LVNRRGKVTAVVVGEARELTLPDLPRPALKRLRFSGLRHLHTHLKGEAIGEDDLFALARFRLDLVLAVTVTPEGFPGPSLLAHLLPDNPAGKVFEVYDPIPAGQLQMDFQELIRALEEELARSRRAAGNPGGEGVILVKAVPEAGRNGRRRAGWTSASAEEELAELEELARSSGVVVLDRFRQQREKYHSRFLVGEGKLRQISARAMQLGADTLIYDHELTPAQVLAIEESSGLKVVDRTQLIMDIFAQRARTREGKIQVELAQLRYLLPRLVGRGVEMSRLTGGIGTRGPGETKLEVDRRKIRDRIHHLERDIGQIRKGRATRRVRRERREAPVVSIVGYTNTGKSTLLNALTNSQVAVADQMFATLDPTSRRLRFPREREIIITDTVGFIRDLPKDLLAAFRATLEELTDADLFLHVADASIPNLERQAQTVEQLLKELDFTETESLLVLNKADLLEEGAARSLARRYPEAVLISALDRATFRPLLRAMEDRLWPEQESAEETLWQALGF
jgi:GTP-binding protein HflX